MIYTPIDDASMLGPLGACCRLSARNYRALRVEIFAGTIFRELPMRAHLAPFQSQHPVLNLVTIGPYRDPIMAALFMALHSRHKNPLCEW